MIPRFEPTAQTGEALAFIMRVLCNRTPDDTINSFEKAFADTHGGGEAIFVPSGRMALWLILQAAGHKDGAEIIVPAFTYFAIPAVIRHAGLVPVYADIDPNTYELTPESVSRVLTDRTCAVLPTHLFGRTCPLPALDALCREKGVMMIEDCAQSFGAVHSQRKTGSWGQASYFTFGITKNFTTFSGGMVLCREAGMAAKIREAMSGFRSASRLKLLKEGCTALAMRLATQRILFNLSLSPFLHASSAQHPDSIHLAFEEKVHGINNEVMQALRWRPNSAQAQAGLHQLEVLDAKNAARRKHGTALRDALASRGCVGLPKPPDSDGDHIFMSFAIRRKDRFAYAARLRKRGVDVSPGYMSDCSSIEVLGGRKQSCPNSAAVSNTILHLPLYPGLRPQDIEHIADAVAACDREMQ